MTHALRTLMTIGAAAGIALTAVAFSQPHPTGAQAALSAPKITGISPAIGPTAGGTIVTISGTGFVAGATVTLSGTPMVSVSINSDTQIVATTSRTTTGPANLRVLNPDGGAAILTGGFFFQDPGSVVGIDTVSPNNAPTTGGMTTTITGTGFAGTPTVYFGGVPAPRVIYQGPSLLSVQAPAGTAGTVNVSVRNPDGTAVVLPNAFTFTGGVQVTALSPVAGPSTGGTTILITGTGFAPGATVTIGGTPATSAIIVNSTQIVAKTPAGALGDAAIVVTNPGGATGTMPAAFRFASGNGTSKLAIGNLAPANGPTSGGTQVSLSGSEFSGGISVLFGGVPAADVVWNGASSLFVRTPANISGPVPVTVVNSDGATVTLANGFTYEGPNGLTATAISPSSTSAPGATSVIITGTGFQSGAWVTFGGTPATTTSLVGSNQVVAVPPSGLSGTVSVTVNGIGGLSATLPAAFTFTGGGTSTPPASVTPAPTPATGVAGPGTFASPPTFSTGSTKLAQSVFNGGTIVQLDAALIANNASGAWAQTPNGTFVLYIVGAPAFANAGIANAFPSGLPGVIALTLVGK